MTSISRGDVAHLARLSRLELSDSELESFARQLTDILDHVQAVSEVAADDVPAMSHPTAISNVYRADVVTPGLTPDQALDQAPAADQQRFEVPQILGEEA
ncbi:glutamyl-tRNA amidotransferase [Dietzia sp. UCD-THP]|uniref:Aspartyl/glutamyl-tRNA(Asn/Gln) amidotransferase subunit C n=1 Tax=Dietzia natronolimnaea TaxID=161920 RepID=A0A2A2WPH6_9ACTN|nr:MULTISPECIES: Asp-tRNA(Asn)/Glu-tRNA(Gln) amidotransferase subunit GatC [Dietzia]EYT63312.1 glutamyl-tRNA amidotransferase [Dietzia sp. UCD-THP]PAY23080.1 Asp-tRNA(Asn)/Glu-tRNA(Gln) amidotransferase GatCAB subunit C [Dietzia natronolimnaea]